MNPEGYIALCMAENKLVQESFARRLMQPATAINAFSDSVVYGYNSFLGLPSAREAAAVSRACHCGALLETHYYIHIYIATIDI